jgi:hypothetical protein
MPGSTRSSRRALPGVLSNENRVGLLGAEDVFGEDWIISKTNTLAGHS